MTSPMLHGGTQIISTIDLAMPQALGRSPARWLVGSLLIALCSGSGCRPAESLVAAPASAQPRAPQPAPSYEVNDAHVHLTNYIQEGPRVTRLLEAMGGTVGRATLFGIPLQQLWSTRVSGDYGPTYYLNADTPLYYYSFTDAIIASAYLSLGKQDQARLDPMITGFNPADMYGADHIRRVLQTFPGVFSGIGEFTIHKEFVSSKVAGEVASLSDPALDRILAFAAEAGLLVLMHNDIDVPFPKPDAAPAYLAQMKDLLKRHPNTTIIWAHLGVGRVIRPVHQHAATLEAILQDPAYAHVYFDISWQEVAKYLVASEQTLEIASALINRYPDRFLYGSDEVGPATQAELLRVFHQYAPLLRRLTPEASEKLRHGNYTRLFDAARRKVRAWEKAHPRVE
jgi:hypothetical protein